MCAHCHGLLSGCVDGARFVGEAAGDVLLQHGVKVGAPETEGAHTSAPDSAVRFIPGAQFPVDHGGGPGEIRPAVGPGETEAGGEHPLVQGEGGLQNAGGASGALEVADVGLHRAEGDAARRAVLPAEHFVDACQLHGIPHRSGGAVPFNHARRPGRAARDVPGAPNGPHLARRVGRHDPLAPPIAGAAETSDHGVDAISVPLGIFQPPEEEHGRPLAHDEAIGFVVVGARSGGRQRPDLAELDVRGGPHVGVHAPGEHGVKGPLPQPVHGGGDGGHGGSAGSVGDIVRPMKIEHRRHPPGDDVRQLARHGVLGDSGEPVRNSIPQLLQQSLTSLLGERREAGRPGELLGELGEQDARRSEVVQVP